LLPNDDTHQGQPQRGFQLSSKNRGLAPGARVTLRDKDWDIRRIDPSDDGGQALTRDGLSELVRGISALFLDRLEDDIQIHAPAHTQLFQDTSD